MVMIVMMIRKRVMVMIKIISIFQIRNNERLSNLLSVSWLNKELS